MKRYLFALGVLCIAAMPLRAEKTEVKNLPGNMALTVEDAGGVPTYSLSLDGKQMIAPSPMGLTADFGDFSTGMTLESWKQKPLEIDYSVDRIKKSHVKKTANDVTFTFRNRDGRHMDVEFVLTDNDAAFRYTLSHEKGTGSVRVMDEATGFALPAGSTAFLTHQSDPMIGWKRTKPSYEEDYIVDAPLDTKSQYGHGFTFPGLFRVGDDGWILVSETGTGRDYAGCRLSDYNDGRYKVEFPMAAENNGNGTVEPAFALPGSTPWRTITMGRDLKPIVETTVPWDVVEEVFPAGAKYEPGRGTWSWIMWQDDSINDRDIRTFVDFAAALGWEYTLIDCGWDKNIGWDGMECLIKDAKAVGVEPILWYSSSGYWNDITQSPINRMENPRIRRQEMKWLHDNGVKAIKVDFFGGDKQETMRLYEAILTDANDFGIMVIFHGCTLPRGWERMFPNYIGSEAVLASENLIFQQDFCDKAPLYDTLHPFIRNAVGSMEYGGSPLNRRMHRSNEQGNYRRTTDAFELATAVLFQSPQQNFALAPNNLEDAPAAAIDFMKSVPTMWTDTRFIEGYPGRYVLLERDARDGGTYTAGINAEKTARTVTLKLQSGSYTLLSDGKDGSLRSETLSVKRPRTLKVTMRPNGGFVLAR